MKITQKTINNFTVIYLEGEINNLLDVELFKKTMDKLLEEGKYFLAINFDNASTLSSEYISIIMSTHIALKKLNGDLVLIGSEPTINNTLSIVGIPMIMSVYFDENSFEQEYFKNI